MSEIFQSFYYWNYFLKRWLWSGLRFLCLVSLAVVLGVEP